MKEKMSVTGAVPPAKRQRQESSSTAGSNADAISSNQVSVEHQVVNYY